MKIQKKAGYDYEGNGISEENGFKKWFDYDKLSKPIRYTGVLLVALIFIAGKKYLINDMLQGGNQLYVLETTIGAWGKNEYQVGLAEVETGASDRKNTVITSELDRGTKIITGWTEPIYAGMTVLPAGYE